MELSLDTSVKEVVSNLFGVSVDSLDDDSSPEQIDGWDSGEHLNLVMSLEQKFNVLIDIDDYTEMSTVGSIKNVLKKYLG